MNQKNTKKKLTTKKKSEKFEIPEILPPKVDIVFKMLFGDERNKDILIAFLEAILNVKISDVSLLDSAIKRRTKEEKMGVLDVKAKLKNGERINIEIQNKYTEDMRKRGSFYSCGMVVEQVGKGNDYTDIKPVITIIIVKKSIIHESKKCHNVFYMLEEDEHFPFNDLQQMHVLDLSRIGREETAELSDWLKFIDAEKEEDFMPLVKKSPVFKKAFGELKVMSADTENRILYESRLKLERDISAATNAKMREGIRLGERKNALQTAKKLRAKGMGVDEVAEVTGLTVDDVLRL